MNDRNFGSWEDAVCWLRQQEDQKALIRASYYDDPLIGAADRYYRSEEWSAIQVFLTPYTGDALDIGAGRGIASYALAKSGFNVTALEPDRSHLVGSEAIKKLAEDANLPILVDTNFSEYLPFDDSSFDVVFARAVFHHMKDLQLGCNEIFRVLKPGGICIAVREHVISKKTDLSAFLNIHPLHHIYGGEHAYLLKEYKHAIKESGLVLKKEISPLRSPINYFPHTKESLKMEILARFPKPLSFLMAKLLRIDVLFSLMISCLSLIDQRPGRLYSFIACKAVK